MKKYAGVLILSVAVMFAGCSMPAGPSGNPGPDGTANEPPQDSEVTTAGFTGYYDLGDYFSLGEVRNNSASPVYEVELLITYLNADGTVLTTDAAAPLLSRVDPGATVPVYNILYEAPEGITAATVSVRGFKTTPLLEKIPLTITNAGATPGDAGVTVQGAGRNDSNAPLSSLIIVASFRDDSGAVTGIAIDYPVIGDLPPGGAFFFEIETFDHTLADDRVLVQGEGTR